jgi:tetratricopeptide (TPR) repeat protein
MLVAALLAASGLSRADVIPDRPHAILGQGVSDVVYGRYADAEKKLREALREDAKLREAHYNLAVVLRTQGHYDDAIAEYAAAEAMYARKDEPNRAKCLYGMALAKEARGDRDAWDQYLAFARPLRNEQRVIPIAEEHAAVLSGIRVPGTKKAAR